MFKYDSLFSLPIPVFCKPALLLYHVFYVVLPQGNKVSEAIFDGLQLLEESVGSLKERPKAVGVAYHDCRENGVIVGFTDTL